MAPPGRSDQPQRADSRQDLETLQLDDPKETRLGHNAARLASWVEWLLHPEEHDYDRTVIYGDGTRREEDHRVTQASKTPGEYEPVDVRFESVIARYNLRQFLDGMTAFTTQQVERPNSLPARQAAALKNVWWAGDKYATQLGDECPDQEAWGGMAADKARHYIHNLATAATQLNKIASEFNNLAPRYAMIVKTARDNLDKAAGELVNAFETKFSERTDVSVDIMGIAVAAVVGAAVTFVTGPASLPLIEAAAISGAWTETFNQAAKALREGKQGGVHGPLWIDLAGSFMRTQADILNEAVESINSLDRAVSGLLGRFETDVAAILTEPPS